MDRDRQLGQVVLDLVAGQARISASFSGVCGVDVGSLECDIVTFSDVLTERIPVEERARIDTALEARPQDR